MKLVTKTADEFTVIGTDTGNTPLLSSLAIVEADDWLSTIHCESKKNCATFIFTVTLANVGRFLKFFQCRNQKEMAHNKNEKFSTVA